MPDQDPSSDAPGTGTGPEGDSGRERLWRAVLKPSRSQVVVGLLLGLVGYAAVTQVRAVEVDHTYAGVREEQLIEVLNGLTGASRRAQAEIDRLEAAYEDLQSGTRTRQAALETARLEADNLAVLAGQVPVRGPGIRITVTPAGGSPLDAEVFLDLLQSLRNAGAEAIQINGVVRLVAQSYFAETAEGIMVDGVPLEAPYVVDVIGPPHGLEGGIDFPGGPRIQFRSQGATVDIEQLNELEITAVRDPAALEYAQADDAQ